MKKLKLRKWVKVLIIVIVLISVILILTHLLLKKRDNFIKYADMCDSAKGSICSYYEVQKFIKIGGYNG